MPPRYSNTHRVGGEVLGAEHLDNALKQLPKATAKNVLRRSLLKAAKPTEAAAIALEEATPRRTKTKDLAPTIEVTTKLKSTQKDGREKVGAVEVFVGSTAPDAHWKEFGTVNAAAFPFLRPAWESTKRIVLATFADEVWSALAKAARTLARKAEKGTLSKTARRTLTGR